MADSNKKRLLLRFASAASRGDVDEVRRLVRIRKVDPNTNLSRPHFITTALHVAAKDDRIELARYLVEEAHCDVDRKNHYGHTALHLACSLPMVRYLVETGGADIEARDEDGLTPLHRAWNKDVAEYLVGQRQAIVDAKDKRGFTPLDDAIIEEASEDIIRFLLPRTSSIAKNALVSLCEDYHPLDIIKEDKIGSMVLEKYALGHGLSSDLNRFPIHTLISHFPLPSTKAFLDCIELFPASASSFLDEQGRLPIHVALLSTNDQVVARSTAPIVSFLFDLEPRSALTRDPCTGLYPHETAASLFSRDDDDEWLDVVFKMFRLNPQYVLQSRV